MTPILPEDFRTQTQSLIRKNMLKRCLIYLNAHLKDNDSLILITNDWEQLQEQKYKNTISKDDYNISKNRIVDRILQLVNDLVPAEPLPPTNDRFLEGWIEILDNDEVLRAFDQDKSVSALFVERCFQLGQNNMKGLSDYIQEWLRNEQANHQIILVGEGGMGKSFFLRYFSRQQAEKLLEKEENEDESNRLAAYLPLLVSLGALNIMKNRQGEEDLALSLEYLAVHKLGMPPQKYRELLRNGKVLFLFDAVDEPEAKLSFSDKFQFLNLLQQFHADYSKNRIILSGGLAFFTDAKLKDFLVGDDNSGSIATPFLSYQRIILLPMEEQEVKQYIQNYFPKGNKAERLYSWLIKQDVLQELSSYPIYLLITCILADKLLNERNPVQSAYDLIARYVSNFIQARERPTSSESGKSYKWKSSGFRNYVNRYEFFKSLFPEIALLFYEHGKMKNEDLQYVRWLKNNDGKDVTRLEWEQIQRLLDRHLKSQGYHLSPEDRNQLEEKIKSQYFLRRVGEQFEFFHPILQNYFISNKLIRLIEAGNLKHRLVKDVEWSGGIMQFAKTEIKEKLGTNTPSPKLLYLQYGNFGGYIRDMGFRLLGRILMLMTRPAVKLTIHAPLVSSLLLITFVWLYLSSRSTLSYIVLGIGASYLAAALFILTKRQWIWNILFRIFARERRAKFNFTAKAFKIAFDNEELSLQTDKDLYYRLFSTYTMFSEIKDVEFNRKTILKHNLIDIRFKSFKFVKGYCLPANFYKCVFDKVKFTDSYFYLTAFENCDFTETDFSGLKYKHLHYKQISLARKALAAIRLIRRLPGQSTSFVLEFRNCVFDPESLSSLKAFAENYNLTIGKHIDGDKTLLKQLLETSRTER